MIVNERITAYINSLDRGNGSLCDEVEEEAVSSYVPIIRKRDSALLKTLVAMKRPERILEVGTAVGYSALLMSRVMPENCHITTIEKYEKRIPIAKENFIRAGEEERITLLEGDAEEILGSLSGPYDFHIHGCGQGTISPLAAGHAEAASKGRSPGIGQCTAGRRYYRVPLCGGAEKQDNPCKDERVSVYPHPYGGI